MPILKRELAFVAASSAENSGDWWRLVLDTDTRGLYVEHTWMRTKAYSDGQIARGEERFGINDFLAHAQDQPAHPTLVTVLREIFREADAKPVEVAHQSDQPWSSPA